MILLSIADILSRTDAQALIAVNGLHSPAFDSIMQLVSNRFTWVPLYVLLAWFVLRRMGITKGLITILAVILAVTIADQTCATLLRPFFERPRPTHSAFADMLHIVDGYRGGSYGFPSCHAANTAAVATFFALMLRRNPLTYMLIGWALLNCYSRMYLGVHYPGDLLAGSAVGIGSGWLCQYGVWRWMSVPRLVGRHLVAPVLAVGALIMAAIMSYSLFV